MNYHKRISFTLVLLTLYATSGHSQDRKVDSLKNVLAPSIPDSNKVNTLNALALELDLQGKFDPAISYSMDALSLAQDIGFKRGEAIAAGELGIIHYLRGSFPEGLKYGEHALKISEELGDRSGVRKALANMGIICLKQSNYPQALNYFFKALKIAEELNNKSGMATDLGNIGIVYMSQASSASGISEKNSLWNKALDYYSRALKMQQELNDTYGMINNLSNLAGVYSAKASMATDTAAAGAFFSDALNASMEALKLAGSLENPYAYASVLGNIGTIYFHQAEKTPEGSTKTNLYNKALDCFSKALATVESMGVKNAIAHNLGAAGHAYFKMKNYAKAEEYLNRALVMAGEIGELDLSRIYEEVYSQMETERGNHKSALAHYKKFIAARDSISNELNTRKQTQTELQYEFDKKESLAKLEQDKKDAATKTLIYSISGGLLLMVILTVFVYNSYKQKRNANIVITRQKEETEHQRLLLEEKQKEILDSIHYARRIQKSLMPTEKYIGRQLERLIE